MALVRCNNEPIYMQNTYNTIRYIVHTIVLYYERLSNNKAIICTVKMEIDDNNRSARQVLLLLLLYTIIYMKV